jgi:hypothetical protein
MTRHVIIRDHDLTDSQKIDMVMRKLFGDIDESTLQTTEGHFENFADLKKQVADIQTRINWILYGGGVSSSIVVSHILGVPVQSVWQFLSHIPSSVVFPH